MMVATTVFKKQGSAFMHSSYSRLSRLIFKKIALLTGVIIPLWAVPLPAMTADQVRPNWSGVWVLEGSFMDKQDGSVIEPPRRRPPAGAVRSGPELKGIYAEAREEATRSAAAGIQIGDSTAGCLPQGMPAFWGGPFAFEIMQSPVQINIFSEWNEQTRRIYVDGRKHPEELDPAFNGHSVGYWEGDTLVVDSIGFREQRYLAMINYGHSEHMRIVERMRLVEPDILEVVMQVTDEAAFINPWSRTMRLKRRQDMEIQEYVCSENNRNTPDESGVTTVILSGEE